jgi:lipoprotein-releasing system permease protein
MFRNVKLSKYLAQKIVIQNPERALSKPIVRISVISIALSTAVMILSVCMVDGFKKETITQIRKFYPDIILFPKNAEGHEWNYLKIHPDSISNIKNTYREIEIYPYVFKTSLLSFGEINEGLMIKGLTPTHPSLREIKITKGRWFSTDDKNQKQPEIVLPETFAGGFGMDTGATCKIHFLVKIPTEDSITKEKYISYVPKSRKFRVCGLYKNTGSDAMNEPAFTSVKTLQKINAWDSLSYSGYEFFNKTPIGNPELVRELNAYFFHNYEILPMEAQLYAFFVWLNKLDINGYVIIGLMAVVCVVNAMMALLILIIEQVKEIGLLKAMGMTHSGIRNIFFFVAWHILLKGILTGNIIGLLLAFLQWKFKIITLDPSTYYIDFVAVGWNWTGIISVNIGLIIFTLIMLLLPTRYISTIMPFRILRYE